MKYVLPVLCVLATPAFAEGLVVENAMVPAAPPKAMAHAAYFELTNHGDAERSLIGVTAPGYGMAHIHRSTEKNGVSTMEPVHQIGIAPGQTVAFAHGGLHIMLMRPAVPAEPGNTVDLVLEFANGETVPVSAMVMKRRHGS